MEFRQHSWHWGVDRDMNAVLQSVLGAVLMIVVAGAASSCTPECDDAPAACDLLPDPGPCFAAIPKFYFDSETQECKEFTWGGCGGVVPFDTFDACQECQCD